ncbi:MAG TPA: hypothetical protein VFL76_07400 [Edaphocola sp.]|nr:hypothetical protein [Edaphocola sp.]
MSKNHKQPKEGKKQPEKIPDLPEQTLSPAGSMTKKDYWFKRLFFGSLVVMLGIFWIAGYNSGVCYDELTLNVYGKDNIAFYTSGGQDTSFMHPKFSDMDGAGVFMNTLRYYGSVFEYIVIGINKVTGNLENGYEYNTSHAVNQFFAVLGILFTGLLARRLTRKYRSAFMSAWLLFLTPIIFGLSLFDTKDIPFMAGYIATLYYSVIFLEALPKPDWKTTIGLMLSLFFAFGIRVGAALLVMYLAVFLFIYTFGNRGSARMIIKNYQHWIYKLIIAVGGALSLTVLTWPFLILSPVKNFMAAVDAIRNFPQRVPVTYEGLLIDSLHIPQSYLPHFMLMTIPALVIIAVFATVILVLFRRQRFRLKPILFVLFASLFPVFYAMYNRTPLYGSWRQFLFVYPGLAVVATIGIDYVLDILPKPVYQWVFGAVLLLGMASPLSWIIRIRAPYQYVYFNEFTGGFAKNFYDYDKDYYYGSSLDAVRWLVENAPLKDSKDTMIVATDAFAFTHYFFKRCYPDLKVKVVNSGISGRNMIKWDYALLNNIFYRHPQLEEHCFPPAQTIHTIDIDGMPVVAVLHNAHHYNSLGLKAMAQNNFAVADSLFSLFLKETNYRPGVTTDMGGISGNIAFTRMTQRKFSEAEALAQNALIFTPNNYPAYLVLGVVNFEKGDMQKAKQNLSIAIRINPKDVLARQYLARIK